MSERNDTFDFEYWAKLWQDDPEAFEGERIRVIESIIAAAPAENRPRLRRFQWRIDIERRRSRTPYQAYQRLANMMWESLLGERGLLQALQRLATASEEKLAQRQSATVIPFCSAHNKE